MVISDTIENTSFYYRLLVSLSYYVTFIISAVVGAVFLYKKLRKKAYLSAWILIGALLCILSSILINEAVLPNAVMGAAILGAALGTGIPTCLAFFAHYTKIASRGRVGAAVFFAVQLATVFVYMPISDLDVYNEFIVLTLWRLLGIAGIIFYAPTEKLPEESTSRSFFSVFSEKSFTYYFIPWFLFCLVNFVEAPLLEHFFSPELFGTYTLVEFAISSISAFFGGVLCDLKGRKITGITGFVLLGISYAILSIFSGVQFFQFLYVLFDGVAWGILYVTFIFVVWGDLSESRIREWYYIIGVMPFLLSGLIRVFVEPFVEVIPIYTSFSLASFFLFLAILPLLFAPETLPEKKIRDRELREYIEKAMKAKEKHV